MALDYGGLPSEIEARASIEDVDRFIALKNAESKAIEKRNKQRSRPAGVTVGPDLLSGGD